MRGVFIATAYLATQTAFAIGIALAVISPVRSADIPSDAQKWRRTLTREAQAQWGVAAPVADFAAQIHQESAWRSNALSRVGAKGMAQFMPGTASWIVKAYPSLGPDPLPENPQWAIRALVTYDRHIWEALSAADECNRMAKTLSGYNGGPGWVTRDEQLTKTKGLNPAYWWGNVETVNSGRSKANWDENRGYPRRILVNLAPRYVWADWGWSAC